MWSILRNRTSLPIMLVCSILVALCRVQLSPFPSLKLAEDQCWSGQNSTSAAQHLDDLQKAYTLEEIFEGPGLLDNRDNRSACKFVIDDHTPHFPHAMQQLYRCFSWWSANPNKEPYLIMFRQPLASEFLTGMIARLRDVFGVRVVNFRHNLKVVRGKIGYDWDERHAFSMRSKEDARALRDGILDHYRISSRNMSMCSNVLRIGILDRKLARSLQNRGAMIKAIEKALTGRVIFRVIEFESRSFYEQVEFLATTDILISPHGAQLTGIPFLPNCATVLELFPAGYLVPYFYGSLAAVSGVAYSYVYLGRDQQRESEVAMKDLSSRNAARSANLCPNVDVLAHTVGKLVEEWEHCCRTQERHHAVRQ